MSKRPYYGEGATPFDALTRGLAQVIARARTDPDLGPLFEYADLVVYADDHRLRRSAAQFQLRPGSNPDGTFPRIALALTATLRTILREQPAENAQARSRGDRQGSHLIAAKVARNAVRSS